MLFWHSYSQNRLQSFIMHLPRPVKVPRHTLHSSNPRAPQTHRCGTALPPAACPCYTQLLMLTAGLLLPGVLLKARIRAGTLPHDHIRPEGVWYKDTRADGKGGDDDKNTMRWRV